MGKPQRNSPDASWRFTEQLVGELDHVVVSHFPAGLHVGRRPGGTLRLVRFKPFVVAIVDDLVNLMFIVCHGKAIANIPGAVKRLLPRCGG